MAGTVTACGITARATSRVRFAPATEADDADIRRLLRESPMAGRVTISLEREPDYFADASLACNEKQTIVARENGRVVCMGSCTIRERFVNGRPRRVGYLGGLRLARSVAGRFDIVRRGYEFFRELQSDARADFYFTSIAAENVRARQFLERSLPGMPTYEFVGEFVTLLVAVSGSSRRKPALAGPGPGLRIADFRMSLLAPAAMDEFILFLREQSARYQFSPCWSADEFVGLQSLGLRTEDFFLVRENGLVAGCAALWDQRVFKQTVIHSYGPWLALTRPLFNAVSRVSGNPRLPGAGETLANAFVAQLAAAPARAGVVPALIAEVSGLAAARGIQFLTAGFAANDPRLATVRKSFRCREYRSRLYVVRWPGMGAAAGDLDGRCHAPEAALL